MKKIVMLFSTGVIVIVAAGLCPYPIFHHGVLKKVDALLYAYVPDEQLPKKFSVTFGNATASFSSGTPEYAKAISLLRASRSDEAIMDAGPVPHFEFNRVGRLTIPYCLVPFSFPLNRSAANTNYMWIGLPKRTSPGTTWPIIADNGQLLHLVQEYQQNER